MDNQPDRGASPTGPTPAIPGKASPGAARTVLAHMLRRRESGIVLALFAMMAVTGTVEPNFFTGENLYLVSRQISFVAVVALGQLFVILHGGIDLSVGSIMAVAGMVAAYCMKLDIHPALAVVIGTSAGLVIGTLNGALISFVQLTPFIVTLGTLSLASGMVLGFSKGWPITEIPPAFLPIAQGSFLGLPIPVWITLLVAVVAHVVLTYTVFGRRIYALGGNEQATFLSGISVQRIKFGLYLISAGCASIAGIVLVGRFNSAQADTGKGWELDAIAAVVIGGASLSGGSGSVLGVLIGACIMGVIKNALALMRISNYWHTAIIGVIIILAAVIDRVRRRAS
jgi:ribose/xylose/arabinose/galactoside ABC-type transport system permease subunit